MEATAGTSTYTWLSRPLLPWPSTWIPRCTKQLRRGRGGEMLGRLEGCRREDPTVKTPLRPRLIPRSEWLLNICPSLSVPRCHWEIGYICYLFAKSEQNNESFPRLFHSLSIGSLFSAKSRAEQVFDWHKELHWSTRDNVWAHADI